MRTAQAPTRWRGLSTFNSLFEMHDVYDHEATKAARPFNSLFEMLKLSILL